MGRDEPDGLVGVLDDVAWTSCARVIKDFMLVVRWIDEAGMRELALKEEVDGMAGQPLKEWVGWSDGLLSARKVWTGAEWTGLDRAIADGCRW